MNSETKFMIAVFSVVISFGCGYYVCKLENKDAIKTGETFKTVNYVKDNIKDKTYLNNKNQKKAVESAVNAYYQELTDEYFYYWNDDNTESVVASINNSEMLLSNGFEIAAEDDGSMIVVSVEKDSYAESQGLMEGDRIIRINEYDLIKDGFSKSASRILGKNGTTAEIELIRDGMNLTLNYERKFEKGNRERIDMLEDNICYINYRYSFDEFNTYIFNDALRSYGYADSYIIDLRNNGGGSNDCVVHDLDYFLPEQPIFTAYYYDGTEKVYSTEETENEPDKPVILLVNAQTASAAETFTGAMMQFYNDITVVGEKTFGKGITQNVDHLEDGSAVKYTAGYFTVGDWVCWQGKGITPDVEVEMDSELIGTDDDIQLEKAIELLQKKK